MIVLNIGVFLICLGVCFGAGRAYHGKSFNFEKELKWWESKKSKPIAMHPNDIAFIDKYINLFYEYENREYDIRTIFNQIKKEGK